MQVSLTLHCPGTSCYRRSPNQSKSSFWMVCFSTEKRMRKKRIVRFEIPIYVTSPIGPVALVAQLGLELLFVLK